jgi:hypothetical protein
LRRAVEQAGLTKVVTSHTFRHCFATHLLWAGTDIRTIQELLGHRDVATTMIYAHVVNDDRKRITSPLDCLKPRSAADPSEFDSAAGGASDVAEHGANQQNRTASFEVVQGSGTVLGAGSVANERARQSLYRRLAAALAAPIGCRARDRTARGNARA